MHTKDEACELIFTFTISALERICSDGLLKACIKFFLVARAIVNLEKSLGAFCGVFLRSTWQLGTMLQRPFSHVLNFVLTRSFFSCYSAHDATCYPCPTNARGENERLMHALSCVFACLPSRGSDHGEIVCRCCGACAWQPFKGQCWYHPGES